jgi:hypothetical protein
MMFFIGQKVVCVDATQPEERSLVAGLLYFDNDLRRGAIYTVQRVGLTHPGDPEHLPCIEVDGADGWPVWAHRFRPVVERKTDISCFTKLIAPAPPRKVDVRANATLERDMIDDDLFHNGEPVPR